MQLAYSTLACPKWTLEQIIDAAQRNGYQGLEFRLLNGEVLPANLDKETRRRVLVQCASAGLKIICVDTSIKIATQDSEGRKAQIRDGLAYLDMAAEWDAPYIRVFGGTPEGTSKEDAIKASVECLGTLMQRGKELGIRVLLETHDAFASSAMVMAVLKEVPEAGALWDTLHPYRVGEQPAETAARLGERCDHMHIKDGRRNSQNEKWDLTLLGEGEVPIPAILSMLHQQGYSGWLSVEWEKKGHPEIAEPEIAIPQHAEVLQQYLTEIER